MVLVVRSAERASSDSHSFSLVDSKLDDCGTYGQGALLSINVVVILKSARFAQVRRKSLADRLRT